MNLKLRSVIAVNYLVNLPMWRDNEGLVKLRELYIYNGVLYLKLVESKQSCSPESNGKEPKHICGAHRTSHGLHLAQWRPSTRLERPCHHDRAPAISKSNKKSKIDKKKHQNLGMTRKKVPLLLPQAHIVERFTCRGTTGWRMNNWWFCEEPLPEQLDNWSPVRRPVWGVSAARKWCIAGQSQGRSRWGRRFGGC